MTREESLAGYEIENNQIVSLGRFENAPMWTPYFYDLYLNGFCDEETEEGCLIMLDPEDFEMFPELPPDAIAIVLLFDDNGFIDSYLQFAEDAA